MLIWAKLRSSNRQLESQAAWTEIREKINQPSTTHIQLEL